MKDEKMVTVSIDTKILEGITKIAREEGTNEQSIITDILSEAIEEHEDSELLEKVKRAESEFEKGKAIRLDVDEFNKRYGL